MNKSFYKSILFDSPMGYAYYEAIFDSAGLPCDFKFIEANQAFELLTGISSNHMSGKSVYDVTPTMVEDDLDWIFFYENATISKEKKTFERYSKHLKKWFKITVFSLEKGFFITLLEDITKEKEQNLALSKLEHFMSLLDKTTHASEIKSHGNESWQTYKDLRMFLESLEMDISTIDQWVNAVYQTKHQSLDKEENAVAVDHKNCQKFSKLIMDSTSEAIYGVNEKNECTFVNYNFLKLFGYENEDELIGKNIHQLIHHSHKDGTHFSSDDCYIENVIRNGRKDETFENDLWTKDGKMLRVEFSINPQYDDNKLIGSVVAIRDVTEIITTNEKLKESELKFRVLFENAPFGYQSLDQNGHFLEVNRKWTEIFGYQREEVIGRYFADFLHPDYRAPFKKRFELFKKLGSIYSEFKMTTKEGKMSFIGFSGEIFYNKNGEFQQTHCTVSDITEITIANEKLKRSELHSRALVDNLDAGVVIHASDASLVDSNDRVIEILKIDLDELKHIFSLTDKYVFMDLDYKVLPFDKHPVSLIFKHKMPLKNFIVGFKHLKNDHLIWLSVNGVPLFNDEGTIEEAVISFTDITEEKKKQDEITYLSDHDYLTGLKNRRYFVEKYKELDHPEFYPLAVMMMDVNGLKIINDAFGHTFGDIALKKFANILSKSFRDKDVICRIGGDEFAVILPNTTQDEVERIKDSIQMESKISKVENVELSISSGYEISTEKFTNSLDDILRLAENHMYRHKLSDGISVRNNAIKAILETLNNKYEIEKIHSERVSRLCREIGMALGIKTEDLKELELAGMYHDIGKISIPDEILNKPGKLTKEEYDIIKTHPEISYKILRAADEYSDLAIHALHHHERWDGKGYPRGKQGKDIPLFSRIIGVADSYEAMTSIRPYKDKMSEEDAIKEVIRCSGTQFDPHIVKTFVKIMQMKIIDDTHPL